VPRLFAVNRPLLSSKLKRLPTRGMLGNGLRVVMGAVAAYGGTIVVATRSVRQKLTIDNTTGLTLVVEKTDVTEKAGLSVEVAFPVAIFLDPRDCRRAEIAIRLSKEGHVYRGPSRPDWYSPRQIEQIVAAAPKGVTRDDVMRDVFGDEPAKEPFPPAKIGEVGRSVFGGYYRKVNGTASIDGAAIPFCAEVWASCDSVDRDENTEFKFHPIINRSMSLARMEYKADSAGLRMTGCGLDFKVAGAKRGDYTFLLSVITPYIRLTGDGKAPYLGDFKDAIAEAVGGAAREAYRKMLRPTAAMSVKDAARSVMQDAYLKASDNGTLPAKARQIMYAARGEILRLTGLKKFSDTYFTQVLLPDYIQDNPEETDGWDVVYDARGNITEPHTGRRIALGTIQVRQYLGDRPRLGPAARIEADALYPTRGPRNRYRNVLFVEKEGFDELFEAVQLAERFDLAIMSTKGMSVVAARALLDRLADEVDHILVLHDLDVSGFSIVGTLGTDSRRYTFENDMSERIIDIGLRLEDVEAMGLEPEVVEPKGSRQSRRETLEDHGATDEEIEFLAPEDEDEDCRRVELNAMTSRQLVDFVEAKLHEHDVDKVMPDGETLERHARRLIEARLTEVAIAGLRDDIAKTVAAVEFPEGLWERVDELLIEQPELPWDAALAEVLRGGEGT
jgi:hypothetical protein